MTAHEFFRLCAKLCIAAPIALENEAVQTALRERNDAEVYRLLHEEF